MTIANEITKFQTNLSNAYTSCESKGATMPSSQNFDNLATTIDSIETGGGSGGGISFPAGTRELILNNNSTIEVEQLKGAFQNLTSTRLNITTPSSHTPDGMNPSITLKSGALKEAFKNNTNTQTVDLSGISTFATDSLVDCFLNSSVQTISVTDTTNYNLTTGYDNKWGAPTATIVVLTRVLD